MVRSDNGLNNSWSTPPPRADLNANVYNFWDRGLLGLALSPTFPADPYVYALYTYDHELGSDSPAPRWGTTGVYSDRCPTPPGPTGDGCVVSGRLSRFQANGNRAPSWSPTYPGPVPASTPR